jgi:poly(3-hydroxybutyrate) depolymerase
MSSKRRDRWPLALAVALFAAAPAPARAQGPALSAYNAAIEESSVSGISSGAFMAVQLGFAWSSVIKGVGVVAGGPFYCAQASAADFINGYTRPVLTATGPCMRGPPPDLAPLSAKLDAKAAAGEIDRLDHVRRQKIYLFHGYNDTVVARTVSDAAVELYRRHLGEAARGNLFYQNTRGAGHSFVVKEEAGRELNACAANQKPFIDQCGYDQAGIILQHIYGALRPGMPGELRGAIKRFDQGRYTGRHIPGALSMSNEGYVFVPADCEQGAACRVHVALHGCQQGVESIGRLFVERTGYNAWAGLNRIIVLYPQAETSPFMPANPNGCWDWWSYVDHSDRYVTKAGPQIAAIKAMLEALTAGSGAAPTTPAPTPSQAGSPAELIVNDLTDTAAALAWTRVDGAAGYRVSRAGADGAFVAVGETKGPSYGDHGLAPATAYAWRVTALLDASEGAPSAVVRATTRPTPAPCGLPGSCP